MSIVFSASSNVWLKKKATLTASSTQIVDKIVEASFDHADYIITYRNASGNQVKSLKLALHKVDGGIKDQVYSKFGNPLNIKIFTAIVSGFFELSIQNNETFDVEMKLARILL